MTANGLADAVRTQLAQGRLLPLGEKRDAVWIAERAAAAVLAEAERAVPGIRLTAVRVTLTDPQAHDWAVRTGNPAAPPSALPAGPLRVEASLLAAGDRPLPPTAAALRAALAALAADRLGLTVTGIDLRVEGLLDDGAGTGADPSADPGAARLGHPGQAPAPRAPAGEPGTGAGPAGADDRAVGGAADGAGQPGRAAAQDDPACVAARAVPGVRSAVRGPAPEPALRLHLTVAADHRALDVARAVRAATGAGAVVVSALA